VQNNLIFTNESHFKILLFNLLNPSTMKKWSFLIVIISLFVVGTGSAVNDLYIGEQPDSTHNLVALVKDAAALILLRGETAFEDFRVTGSRWREGETYIFILDPAGNMLVHADPEMEGRNQLDLEDINGKPIIRGLLATVMTSPDKPEGWYHYQWPVPGGILPRWKSSFVQLVKAPSGKNYIVGSGMYNDRMEREFVVDIVRDAVAIIEKKGKEAFRYFYDPTSPFIAKDAYVFVIDRNGIDLVNPGFPNLEGRNLLDFKDTHGKLLIREMFDVVEASGSGWVDYMWPKPGENISTQKSAFVSKVKMGSEWALVGCGVYLSDAPKALSTTTTMTASQLMSLVRDAGTVLEEKGEAAFPEFRKEGSKWFQDDTYLFVWNMDGVRIFHAANPESEGVNVSGLKDILGRPIGKMFLEAAATSAGEGWIHYMYPEPGDIFPTWKSSFVKRVQFPSGKSYIVGCGIYNMQMDKAFIEDMVDRAATLVADQGKDAFDQLRDRTGPFVFMDAYVFVDDIHGVELVNAAQPSLEGKNLINLKDIYGKYAAREYIDAALRNGSAWVGYYWYRPGDNVATYKHTYVRKVKSGTDIYIVGGGFYEGYGTEKRDGVRKMSWESINKEEMSATLSRQMISGEKGTLARLTAGRGTMIEQHYHPNEEYSLMLSGVLKYIFDDRELVVNAGEIIIIPANIPHSIVVLDDAEFIDFFVPVREDWLRGEDQYLRSIESPTLHPGH
jgi:signal transduction histidine kinase/quercetin dioxygenase-like cupin family protein